jgi:hypothetical protein
MPPQREPGILCLGHPSLQILPAIRARRRKNRRLAFSFISLEEHTMAQSRPLTRRTALTGLGIGSLGLFFGAAASAAPPAFETGGSGGGKLLASAIDAHPLTGLWLAHLALAGDGDETAAAPAFFGADGTAVLVYPCAEANDEGTQIRGLALGTWAPIDDHEARFTAVQVCFGADGSYQGTRTYDGYPVVSEDGASFLVKGEFDVLTVRDAGNAIVASISGARRAMFGNRMTPGNAGFAAFRVSDSPENDVGAEEPLPSGPMQGDPALPWDPHQSEEAPNIPEVAPVRPDDPRLTPDPEPPLRRGYDSQ